MPPSSPCSSSRIGPESRVPSDASVTSSPSGVRIRSKSTPVNSDLRTNLPHIVMVWGSGSHQAGRKVRVTRLHYSPDGERGGVLLLTHRFSLHERQRRRE